MTVPSMNAFENRLAGIGIVAKPNPVVYIITKAKIDSTAPGHANILQTNKAFVKADDTESL